MEDSKPAKTSVDISSLQNSDFENEFKTGEGSDSDLSSSTRNDAVIVCPELKHNCDDESSDGFILESFMSP